MFHSSSPLKQAKKRARSKRDFKIEKQSPLWKFTFGWKSILFIMISWDPSIKKKVNYLSCIEGKKGVCKTFVAFNDSVQQLFLYYKISFMKKLGPTSLTNILFQVQINLFELESYHLLMEYPEGVMCHCWHSYQLHWSLTVYISHDGYWQRAYQKFLVA